MSDSSASANLLGKDDEDESPASSSTKDNNSTLVDASGDKDSSWRKHSDTSSSPDLLVTGKTDGIIKALGKDTSSDEDEGATEEEVPTEAQVIQKSEVSSYHPQEGCRSRNRRRRTTAREENPIEVLLVSFRGFHCRKR